MLTQRTAFAALAAVVALGLAGCTPGALDTDSSTAPTSEPAPEPTTTDSAEPTEPTESGEPITGDIGLRCVDVLTPDQVYAFNPQMQPTETPTGGFPGEFGLIEDADGIVCAWEHTTSGDVLVVGAYPAGNGGFSADPEPYLGWGGGIVGDWSITVASQYFLDADAEAQAVVDMVGANLASI